MVSATYNCMAPKADKIKEFFDQEETKKGIHMTGIREQWKKFFKEELTGVWRIKQWLVTEAPQHVYVTEDGIAFPTKDLNLVKVEQEDGTIKLYPKAKLEEDEKWNSMLIEVLKKKEAVLPLDLIPYVWKEIHGEDIGMSKYQLRNWVSTFDWRIKFNGDVAELHESLQPDKQKVENDKDIIRHQRPPWMEKVEHKVEERERSIKWRKRESNSRSRSRKDRRKIRTSERTKSDSDRETQRNRRQKSIVSRRRSVSRVSTNTTTTTTTTPYATYHY